MDDTRSASLVLIVGAAGVAYWWYHLTSGKLSSGGPSQQPAGGPQQPAAGALGAGTGQQSSIGQADHLTALLAFANRWGLRVTSGEKILPGGQEVIPQSGHTSGSLHYSGNAVDVAGSVTDAVKQAAAAIGIHILPELYTGMGPSGPSTGPHYHLSFPQIVNGREIY